MESNHSGEYSDNEDKSEPEKPIDAEDLVQTGAIVTNQLLSDIRSLIENRRIRVAQAINTELVLLYWHIGKRIRREIIGEGRASYGERVVEELSKLLTIEYGKGFSRKSLFHMIRFTEAFPEEEIVSALSRQLTWSHFLELIYLKEALQREFYAEMCRRLAMERANTTSQNSRHASACAQLFRANPKNWLDKNYRLCVPKTG